MPGAPLSLPEREEISLALIEDRSVSWAEIGRRTSRHPTTISREVTASGGRERYRPATAEQRAAKALCRPRVRRLAVPGPLRDRVTTELRLGRSPAAIWADLVADGIEDRVCVESLYAAVYAGTLDVKATECLRSRRPRRRGRQVRHESMRPGLPNISTRPGTVGDRSEIGHWEGDQIIGANNASSMLWLTERVTRFSIGVTMPDGYSAGAMVGGLVDGLERIPAHLLRSVTFDQGSEWAQWEVIADTYDIDVWFCDPHSPWQRGQVENQNRQWRWWFPRGTNLKSVEPAHVDHVASIINGQRRRNLGYQSPAALYAAATVR
jgi:IS30 family transposase